MKKPLFLPLLFISLSLQAQQKTPVPSTFGNMLGVNAFEWNFLTGPHTPNDQMHIYEPKMQVMEAFCGFRHYLDWQKIEPKRGSYTFNPTNNGGWNLDVIYERCKQDGIEVLADIKGCPDWLQQTYPPNMRDGENVPMPYGSDKRNPASYLYQAQAAFQFAARYGSNKHADPSLVSVDSKPRWTNDPINQVKIGMGLIKYIECDNERDKWWKGDKAHQTAEEYAANMSAFYDGDKGRLGKGVGVKAADPNIKVVMGGLAETDPKYVTDMINWCKVHRGYRPDGSVDLCFDVINYHAYSSDSQPGSNQVGTVGVAPELSSLGEVADKFVKVGKQYHLPVWVTETGYDLNQGSPQRAIPIGSKSPLITQADWIIRTSFLYARHGVAKVFFYELYDDNSANPIQFASCGLANGDISRRPSADYIYQAKHLLGDLTYRGTINTYPLVDVYRKGSKTVYALMIPDEKGATATVKLSLGQATNAQICNFKPGSNEMTTSSVSVPNHILNVKVTETPAFVIINN
jgi:hypothetical protein